MVAVAGSERAPRELPVDSGSQRGLVLAQSQGRAHAPCRVGHDEWDGCVAGTPTGPARRHRLDVRLARLARRSKRWRAAGCAPLATAVAHTTAPPSLAIGRGLVSARPPTRGGEPGVAGGAGLGHRWRVGCAAGSHVAVRSAARAQVIASLRSLARASTRKAQLGGKWTQMRHRAPH